MWLKYKILLWGGGHLDSLLTVWNDLLWSISLVSQAEMDFCISNRWFRGTNGQYILRKQISQPLSSIKLFTLPCLSCNKT